MSKSGDLNKNIERLKNELRLIKFSEKIDMELLKDGNPMIFLPILHYVFLAYSKNIAQLLLQNNYELFSKSDKEFIEKIFKATSNLFGFKPNITTKQFFSTGYAEAKLVFVSDIIKLIRQENQNLIKKQYNPQSLKSLKNSKNRNDESFRSARSSNSVNNNTSLNNVNNYNTQNNKKLNFNNVLGNNNNSPEHFDEEDFINYQFKDDYFDGNNASDALKANNFKNDEIINRVQVIKHSSVNNINNNIPNNNNLNSNNYGWDEVEGVSKEEYHPNPISGNINYCEIKNNDKEDIDILPYSPKFNCPNTSNRDFVISNRKAFDLDFNNNKNNSSINSNKVRNHFNSMKEKNRILYPHAPTAQRTNGCDSHNDSLAEEPSKKQQNNVLSNQLRNQGNINFIREDLKSCNDIKNNIPNSVQNKSYNFAQEKTSSSNLDDGNINYNNKKQIIKKNNKPENILKNNINKLNSNPNNEAQDLAENEDVQYRNGYPNDAIGKNSNNNNLDFNSLVQILNNLGQTVSIMTNKIEAFKTKIESRVGNLEAELAILKNKFSIFENLKVKQNSSNNPNSQSIYNPNNTLPNHNQNQSQANEDDFFSFAADENLNLTVSSSLQKAHNPNLQYANNLANHRNPSNSINEGFEPIMNSKQKNNNIASISLSSNNNAMKEYSASNSISNTNYNANCKNNTYYNANSNSTPNKTYSIDQSTKPSIQQSNLIRNMPPGDGPIKVFGNLDDQHPNSTKNESRSNNIVNNNTFKYNFNQNIFSNEEQASYNHHAYNNHSNSNNNISNKNPALYDSAKKTTYNSELTYEYTNNHTMKPNSNSNAYINTGNVGYVNKFPNESDDTDALIRRVAERFKETQILLNELK